MKKTLLTLFVSAFALVAGAQNVATQVAGEYVGDLWVALGAPVDTTDVDTRMPGQSITMEAGAAEGTIDFALYNFQFAGMSVGDIALDAVPVSADDAGAVNDNPLCMLSGIKKSFQLIYVAYIASNNLHPERMKKVDVFPRQYERAHFGGPFTQSGTNGASKVPVCTGHKINGFHPLSLLS